MKSELKQKTISGIFWTFIQKALNQGIAFIVTIILARKLMPDDYGVVAIAGMFTALIGVFLDGGMGTALIQKKDADDLDYNTVFYMGLGVSFILYTVIFFASPLVASFYEKPILCPIIRALAIAMPLGAFAGVQSAIVTREMQFKRFFYASFSGQVLSAAVGISMAYMGYGPWALVGQQMVGSITNMLVVFSMVRWHPRWMFSWERFKGLFSFGWKKQAAGFIGTLCYQLRGYIIGYKYSTADLAFYNRGEGLPNMINTNINGPISGVLFPALSKLQGEKDGVKRGIRRSMQTSSFLVFPLLFGLAAVSDQLVPILYSSKWNPAIPFMQIICITSAMDILNATNGQALLAIGRSDIILKLEFYKKPVMLLILAVTTFISPLAIAVGMMLYSFYVLYINTRPNKRYLDYSLREQLRDIMPNVLMALLMAVIVYLVGLFIPNLYICLVVQVVVGAVLYWGMSVWTKNENYLYVRDALIEIYHSKLKPMLHHD